MDKEKEDRISLLPDCLLLEIISRLELSTKEVIKTATTISKRWQHLWTLLPTLVFIDKDDVTCFQDIRPYSNDLADYLSFIDKTLTKCPTNVSLNKFKLQIRYISLANTRHTSQVNSWIRHAITRNVQEVELTICENIRGDGFSYDDELFFNNACLMSMKLSHCVFNPPKGVIRWDKLKCLCIDNGLLDEDSIGKILLESPCLETLELDWCRGFRRIDVTSKSVKNLVLSGYHFMQSIDTIEISAPYTLSLTIKETLYVEKILLLNVSSLVKADLDYNFSEQFVGVRIDDIEEEELLLGLEEELLLGLLASLDHVNEIALGKYNCLYVFSRLEAEGFQFRKGSDRRINPDGGLVFFKQV